MSVGGDQSNGVTPVRSEPRMRRLLRRTPVYPLLRSALAAFTATRLSRAWRTRQVCRAWAAAGCPIPAPPEVKYTLVRRLARQSSCRTLVETGTFLGGMIEANHRHFARLTSIELSKELWSRASTRLGGVANVTLLNGDSAELLPGVVAGLDEPAIFWLDAHYSEGITARSDVDTPVEAEIKAILASPTAGNLVLIDDARDFGKGDYPSIETIKRLIAPRELEIDADILRFRT